MIPLISYGIGKKKFRAVPEDGTFVEIRDFYRFPANDLPESQTCAVLWRDDQNLFFKIVCHESAEGISFCPPEAKDVWEGDTLELFFGSIEPVSWLWQIALGPGGERFDNMGTRTEWKSSVSLQPDGWTAELVIPLRKLPLLQLGVGFNLCRHSVKRGETVSWNLLEKGFHEPENFGELLFTDFGTAFFARTGILKKNLRTEKQFSLALAPFLRKAEAVSHPPFFFNPEPRAMSVGWGTFGMTGAILEYREKGETRWKQQPVDLRNGILRRNSKYHTAHLKNLRPDTVYQCRMIHFSSISNRTSMFPEDGTPLEFTTFAMESKDFSFAVSSDLHSDLETLRRLLALPGLKNSGFLVNLGDMLSCMSGKESFFNGFLDLENRILGKRCPFVFVRGNHEQIGIFAHDYQEIAGFRDGENYSVFQHGGVCFLNLDAGNDKPDDGSGVFHNRSMLKRERRWLQRIVGSDAFRNAEYRIAFLHMPPYQTNRYDSNAAQGLLDGLFNKTGLDLLLCGHVHSYFRINPMSGEITSRTFHPESPECVPRLPFPVIANDNKSMIFVRKTERSLQVEIRSENDVLLDRIEVGKNGKPV